MTRLRALGLALAAVALAVVGEGAARADSSWLVSTDTSHLPAVVATVSVPAASAAAAPTFDVEVGGRRAPAREEPVTGSNLVVAIVVDTTPAGAAWSLPAARSAAAAVLLRLPTGTRTTVVQAAAPSVPAPTSDLATEVAAASRLAAGPAPRLATVMGAAGALHPGDATARRVVLLVGPFRRMVDPADARAVSSAFTRTGVSVYGVGPTAPDPGVRVLAQRTGGLALTQPAEATDGFRSVVAELGHEYRVSFQLPARPDGVVIDVSVPGGSRSAVRMPVATAAAQTVAPAAAKRAGGGVSWTIPTAAALALALGLVLLFAARRRVQPHGRHGARAAGPRPAAGRRRTHRG